MRACLARTAAGLALCATAGVLFPAYAQAGGAGPSPTPTSPAAQIAGALEAAPEPLRANATVLGWRDGKTYVMQKGTSDILCVADQPGDARFQVACYHQSLEPFMARGRELRAEKRTHPQIDSLRLADIQAKKWSMPTAPTTLYNLAAPADSVDATTGLPRGANRWYVVYIPGATEASSGLSIKPDGTGRPWLMYPGMPWAHIMITPR